MKHVLIVDDNPDNLYLLRALLSGHGYSVQEARHGLEGLQLARENPPDLIVSDLLMPTMDGYTLLRHWKADRVLRSIPFVVYTATYTEPKDERLALDLGADAFLVKPSEPEAFMNCVRLVLQKQEHHKLPVHRPKLEESAMLRDYSEVLVRKLEQKAQQLEETNRELLESIARHEKSEAALRLRDRAIQAVSQGILITDPNLPDNPIVYASAGFERITGYKAEEVLGKNCRFLNGKDTDQEIVAELRAAIAGRYSCSVEILNYRKDGTPFWNQLTISPVADSNGRLTHFVGVQNDVTERKRLEEQLRHSQKMEAFGQLAGGVAHDFNNLLTIVSGYSHLLLATMAPDDPKRRSVQGITEAGERAAALTRQLLAFSRQTVLDPKVLDLNHVVGEMEKLLHRLIGEDVLLTTFLDPKVYAIKVDPGHLGQVLMNLAVNARDAMPTGGKLTIETRNIVLDEHYAATHLDVRPGDYVMLAVSDTGCGMTPEVKARLFEPFFTTKEVGKGTGLGLPVVHGIVKQSGGTIEVYSEPGMGSTFKLYFPAVKDRQAAANHHQQIAVKTGTETILLVEDESSVRDLATISLRSFGYTVLSAVDAQEALGLVTAHSNELDLMITDVVMPGMGGGELYKIVRERLPKLKVLFLSGYTGDAVVRHGILEAEVAFLQKPFTPNALGIKVREVLDG